MSSSSSAQTPNARARAMLLLAFPRNHRSRGRAALAAAALLAGAAAAGYAAHSAAEKKKRASRHRRGHHHQRWGKGGFYCVAGGKKKRAREERGEVNSNRRKAKKKNETFSTFPFFQLDLSPSPYLIFNRSPPPQKKKKHDPSHAARALAAAASPSHGSKSAASNSTTTTAIMTRQRRPPPAFWPTMRYLLPLARPKLLALLALAVARTAVANRLARVQGYMFRAAFLRLVPLFVRDFAENVLLCLVAAGIESTAARVASSVARDWRSALTEQVHASYFDGMTYYKLAAVDRSHGIANPEARICEDVPKLADGAAALARETLEALVDAAFFSRELRSYSGTHRYTLAILAYIFGAGGATMGAAPNFGRLIKRQADLEGSYRHLHSRLAANAEPVAFYGGVAREGALVKGAFAEAARHAAHVIRTQWRFAMLQDFTTKYAAATVAVVLIIGPFFRGDLRPGKGVTGRASMLANMR